MTMKKIPATIDDLAAAYVASHGPDDQLVLARAVPAARSTAEAALKKLFIWKFPCDPSVRV